MTDKYEGWGNPFTKSDPTITEFKKKIDEYADEIVSKVPTPEDYIGSHKLVSSVRVRVINDDSNDDYDLVGIDIDQLGGCGCWSGIVLEIRKTTND